MNTNLFLELDDKFVFQSFAAIREYSCSFVAETPFLECHRKEAQAA